MSININETMSQLAQYQRLQDETGMIIDDLKDTIKSYMIENNLEVLNGHEHKATYKTVKSSRIDSAALKKDYPDIAELYSKTTETRRFNFS